MNGTPRYAAVVAALEPTLLPPTSPRHTGVLRLTTGLYTMWYLGGRLRMLRRVHRTDPALFAPVGPCRVLRTPLPPVLADAVATATVVTTALFTIGLGHRILGPAHAALLTWTLSYRNSWSMIYHSNNGLVLHTIALGFTPSADDVSVDRLLRGGPTPPATWRQAVAPLGMNLATVAVYLLSGIAKVAGPLGWRWASGRSLRGQVDADGLRKSVLGSSGGPLGARLRDHDALFTAMAAGSLAVELLAPVALADRRVGRLWSAAAFGMHWGIKAIMNITFRHQLSGVMYLPFILGRRPGMTSPSRVT